ncbi:MAG TPA: 1,4-alpha-glucan branching protein GlgB [Ectothiorhodospiraceae bacterium]|nr:1,4-alpha-glucan branching protein GlgB [Ectothiorhodospiraceae bacterium]
MLDDAIKRLQSGTHHDPFKYLGRHSDRQGDEIIRVFMPSAKQVTLISFGAMTRVKETDLFEARLNSQQAAKLPQHYQISWQEKHDGSKHQTVSAYSFDPLVGELDLYLFNESKHRRVWEFMGAHLKEIDGVHGVQFVVWAPYVKRVSVVGDFNGWNGLRHPMRNRGASGVWELFIPGLHQGDPYKFEILNGDGLLLHKADPYAQRTSMRPETTSLVTADSDYKWHDNDWLEHRTNWDWQRAPVSIYELHLGSWRDHAESVTGNEKRFINYREVADELVNYVAGLGYTHIELMPIMEHPLDESWGYQVSSYFSPTSRFGTPDDLRYLINHCHINGIGVILDWVPAHFPKDSFALAQFTGEAIYEHADPQMAEHQDWGTLIFNYDRHEVRNFLSASALYWIDDFHIDGLRVDAVASMIYLDYSRKEGEWVPNKYGGNEYLEAVEFLKEVNEVVHENYPGVVMIAEESTSWPMVSRPTYMGGLGFSMKWNMGWMNDTLAYFQSDPIHRKYHQDQLTFSQLYAWTENFVLPFSHDEVVHLKKSMLDKMPGDDWQRFANLRLLYTYQYAHPGKKLLFMGGEFGQWHEWDSNSSLDWSLCDYPLHRGLQKLIGDLNSVYKLERALHVNDFNAEGFQWIDCHDSEQSVLSFIRYGDNERIICIFNFTPVPRPNYRIGVPTAEFYEEIFNSDSAHYGGSDMGNGGLIKVDAKPWMGFESSLQLTIPPLGALFLKVK